jgi:hypothetical protein
MCGAYAFKKDLPKYMGIEEKELNYEDLDKFLSINIDSVYKKSKKEFRKLKYGIKFLDTFTRKYYTNVLNHHGGALEDNLISIFEVCNISLHLATPETIMNTGRYFSTYTHGSTKNRFQFASNFNPLISAYLFFTYGVKSADERNSDIVNLHSSSEGWLGRLLASYYTARRNPKKIINYESIDPNIKVVEAFNNLCDILQQDKKYHLKNWFPKIILGGSEEATSYSIKKIDCSFTSPPYLDLEKYPDTYSLEFENIETVKLLSELNIIELESKKVKTKDLHIGDKIKGLGVITKITKLPQCSTKYRKARTWNNNFAKPTMENIYNSSSNTSYFIWNVVNNSKHKTMVDDSVEIAREVGYDLIDTLK